MSNIRKFINNGYVYPVIIVITILFFTLWCGQHHSSLLSDRGRELIIPQEILNGKVPYKDITLIYFPLGFYINALFYKIMGVSINTLLFTQTFLCMLYMLGFYYLAKEFLNKTTSFLITILITSSCIFTSNDLFSMIFPYSFTRAYGIMASFLCVFCFIKLFKTDNLRYLYISAIATGFAISCKVEFLITLLLFIIGLFLYKRLELKQYLKLFLTFLIFPLITISILIYQGVEIDNINDAVKFGFEFANTKVMQEFLSVAGLFPTNITEKLNQFRGSIPFILEIVVLAIVALKLEKKYSKKYFLPLFLIIICYFCYNSLQLQKCWIFLPIIIVCIFLNYFKENLNKGKAVFFLLFASLLLSYREFFGLALNFYGTYSFPLLMLSLCVIIFRYLPKEVFNIELKRLVNYILVILIFMNTYILSTLIEKTPTPIHTAKGTIYTVPEFASVMHDAIEFINNNTDVNDVILTLPEGTLLNFLTDKKTDMHCFMMDRLYHDAYGEKKARDLIASTNSNYIFLFKGFDLNNFHRQYLYDEEATLSGAYIFDNYEVITELDGVIAQITVLKRNLLSKDSI